MSASNPRCFHCFGSHSTARHEQALEHTESVRAIDQLGTGLATAVEAAASSISDAVQEAAAEITYTLEWTHAEAMWAREQQIELLTGILDVALNPQAAQADELFRMAVDSIGRGRSEDAARLLEDSVRLNPGDYRSQISLGHARMALSDAPGALEAFEAARDYARTDGYRKAALRRIGRTQAVLGEPEQAWQTASAALAIADRDSGTLYERSVFGALAIAEGAEISVPDTVTDLAQAIEHDRTLHSRVGAESIFDSIRDSLARSLSQLEQAASEEAARLAAREQRTVSVHAAWGIPGAAALGEAVKQAETLSDQRRYSAYRDATDILKWVASTAQQSLAAACAEFEDGLEAMRPNGWIGAQVHTRRLRELRRRMSTIIGQLEAHAFRPVSRGASALSGERAPASPILGFSGARSVLMQGAATRSEIQSEVARVTAARARLKHNLRISVSPILLWGIVYALGYAAVFGFWGMIIGFVVSDAAGTGFEWGAVAGVLGSWLYGLSKIDEAWLRGEDD